MAFKIQNGQIIPSQGSYGQVKRPGADFEKLYLETLQKKVPKKAFSSIRMQLSSQASETGPSSPS